MIHIESEYASMLSPSSTEYTDVYNVFIKSYKSENVCITSIYKVNNKKFTEEFNNTCKLISKKRNKQPEIIQVFHGTSTGSVSGIIENGFDPKFNRAAAYGVGTYASSSIKTALGYCKDARGETESKVFLCDFVLGTFGNRNNNNIIDTNICDYSGSGTNILVTPYRYGIIPKYLICYFALDKMK